MIRVTFLTILFALLLLAAGPVHGQEATATPIPPDPTMGAPMVIVQPPPDAIPAQYVWAFVVVVVAVYIANALWLRPFIVKLGESAPPAAVEAGFATVDSLLNSGQRFAGRTPTPIDDVAIAELRREVEALKAEIRARYGEPDPRD